MVDQQAEDQKSEMKNLLSKNVSITLAARVLYLVTRFFLPPLTLSYVTLEEYGIWAACFILIGYLGMSAFGVSNVYIRYIAEFHARNETDKINRLLSTGLTMILGLCVILLIALWFGLPWILGALHIPPHLHQKGFILIFVTAATFMLDLSFGAFAYVLTGLQRMVEQTKVWVIAFCIEAVLIVTLLVAGFGIYSLLVAFVIRYVVATIACVALCYHAIPGLSLSLRHFDRKMLRLFAGYGVIVQLSGLMGMFLYSIEKLIAGVFIGVGATAILDIGEKLPVMASQVPATMNVVFLPAMSHMTSLDRNEEVGKLYLKGARYMSMMMGLVLGFLAAFASPLITAWIGPDEKYKAAALILAIVCLPYQMNEMTGPCSAYHRAAGKPLRELFYPISQLVLVLITVSIGFAFFGKTVLAIVGAVGISMVTSALIYMFHTNRYLSVRMGEFTWKVLAPGLLPYALGFALSRAAQPLIETAAASRWKTLGLIAACGIIYMPIAVAALYRLMCGWGEREFLRKQMLHTASGLLRFRKQTAVI